MNRQFKGNEISGQSLLGATIVFVSFCSINLHEVYEKKQQEESQLTDAAVSLDAHDR